MKIQLHQIKIRDIVNGYINNDEDGVVGYDGKLNIRPKYQREFIYNDKQQQEVIRTVLKNFPLNVMYWCINKDGTYELLDGQQRTLSICEYISGNFSVDGKYFYTLQDNQQNDILDYPLMIYICEGDNSEKLDWFEVINVQGEKLTPQELRNAIYTGEWLSDCKKYFSKSNCIAYKIGERYMTGTPIRQELLTGSKEKGLAFTGLSPDKPVILIIGGSLGATAVNEAVRSILPELLEDFQVVHLCGKGKLDESLRDTKGYMQYEYIKKELADLFALADIVISRAGANAICELSALNKPNLLIPLSARASRGDQILNARSFEHLGYSKVLEEEEITKESLLDAVHDLYKNRESYITAMSSSKHKDSIELIVQLFENSVK